MSPQVALNQLCHQTTAVHGHCPHPGPKQCLRPSGRHWGPCSAFHPDAQLTGTSRKGTEGRILPPNRTHRKDTWQPWSHTRHMGQGTHGTTKSIQLFLQRGEHRFDSGCSWTHARAGWHGLLVRGKQNQLCFRSES